MFTIFILLITIKNKLMRKLFIDMYYIKLRMMMSDTLIYNMSKIFC